MYRQALDPVSHSLGHTSTFDLARIREQVGEETWREGRPDETREIFERVALAPELLEFLTQPAYGYLD